MFILKCALKLVLKNILYYDARSEKHQIRTLHVSDIFSVHYQESSTVHTTIHTCYADCLLASSQHNLYNIYILLCVQCQAPDDGQRKCPKHVEFYSKNKFEKLVNLVGFIIRIYHDARSSECQIAGQSNGMTTYGTSLVFLMGSHITINFTLMKT